MDSNVGPLFISSIVHLPTPYEVEDLSPQVFPSVIDARQQFVNFTPIKVNNFTNE